MGSLDDFLAQQQTYKPAKHPAGWEPGVTFDGKVGTITTKPLDDPHPDWSELLKTWGFDPARFRVIEPVQVRTWDAAIGNGETKQFWYYRAQIASRAADLDMDEVDEIKRSILKHKARATPKATGTGGFLVAVADTQMGKSDGGGVRATVDRYLGALDAVKRRARKVKPERILLAGLGDLIEACDGHYAQQTFRVERNLRDQVNIMRRLLFKTVDVLSDIAPLEVACVGGNHGENRKGGKSFTDFADNWDVALFEQVADICSASARLSDVKFIIPKDELSITVDLCGTVVAFAHGHQFRKGATAQQKAENWWKDQSHNRQPVAAADILVSGHYHHLTVTQGGAKTHIQCPAMDGGSDWWINQTGQDAPPGLLTLQVGAQYVGGWTGLEVCR